jgi:TetR/AcrR family transcriptional repressor of nem operon
MGHSRASKQQSHEQIVSTAANCFREHGVDGISIANLMKAAGLTHGGFYKHFESRDDLVTQALDSALKSSSARYHSMRKLTFKPFVQNYLSLEHRDNLAEGCAMAALLNDMARANAESRALYSDQFRRSVELVSGLLDSASADSRSGAMVVLSSMIGALGIARALDDKALSAELLGAVQGYLLDRFPAETVG